MKRQRRKFQLHLPNVDRRRPSPSGLGDRTQLKDRFIIIFSVTDKPVLVGIGVSTAEQAVEACSVADGAIMASALMRQRMDGASVLEVAATVASVRNALDAAYIHWRVRRAVRNVRWRRWRCARRAR